MKRITPRIVESFLSKHWFQVALLLLIAVAVVQTKTEHIFDALDNGPFMTKQAQEPVIQKMSLGFIPDFFGSKVVEPKKDIKVVNNAKYIDSRTKAFIDQYVEIAVAEEAQFGIPASIILANGILLSNLGQSDLAREAQNFFMVPCTRSWDGDSMEIGDACFRWYGSAWESFRDHSLFVSNEIGEASKVSELSIVDWAKKIEAIGWTNLKAQDILRTIRNYELLKF